MNNVFSYIYAKAKTTMCTIRNVVILGTSHDRKAVDIGATARKHVEIAPHLLSAHPLSGCDTVAQIFGIGRAKSF